MGNKEKAKEDLLGDNTEISEEVRDKIRAEYKEELRNELALDFEVEMWDLIREEVIAEFGIEKPKEENPMRRWLYHKTRRKGQIFTGDADIEKAEKEGWVDHPDKVK